jgi:hypothetical protein
MHWRAWTAIVKMNQSVKSKSYPVGLISYGFMLLPSQCSAAASSIISCRIQRQNYAYHLPRSHLPCLFSSPYPLSTLSSRQMAYLCGYENVNNRWKICQCEFDCRWRCNTQPHGRSRQHAKAVPLLTWPANRKLIQIYCLNLFGNTVAANFE